MSEHLLVLHSVLLLLLQYLFIFLIQPLLQAQSPQYYQMLLLLKGVYTYTAINLNVMPCFRPAYNWVKSHKSFVFKLQMFW